MSRCLRQYPGQVRDKDGDVICVSDFHDFCPRQVRDFVPNFVAKSA